MRIAIHAADLDHDRIDGTRVYILNLLRYFGSHSSTDYFLICHKTAFNPQLVPPDFSNYETKSLGSFLAWMHTRFAWEIFRKKPDVLWVPLHNLPWFRRKSLRTVVTIHDLAFKFFPEYFTKKDLFKLNLLSNHAIKKADKIIAISQSTKDDILGLYPEVDAKKITVIHHGFDASLFQKEISSLESETVLERYKLKSKKYLLYVGAIQPRKNLETLVEAFEKIKMSFPEMKLVLAGEKAWMWEGVARRVENSPAKKDIVITGKVPFLDLPALYGNADVFVFPSLYEGFGIPVLEAFAAMTPVVCADNSSLPEVGGEAALYFKSKNCDDLVLKIRSILENPLLKEEMVKRGLDRIGNFSWEKCARETLDTIKED